MESVWEERWSNSQNKLYFLNSKTHESQWDAPDAEILRLEKRPVRASHLLVKHKDSRRPSSWKDDVISRTKEDARVLIDNYRIQLNNHHVQFAELAKTESDCSSAKSGGDLGFFGGPSKVKMQEEFDSATYALEIGELSQPVESASGIHLILRTA